MNSIKDKKSIFFLEPSEIIVSGLKSAERKPEFVDSLPQMRKHSANSGERIW